MMSWAKGGAMIETATFSERRLNLADLLPGIPVFLPSGESRHRNYPAYTYPFRATSHYLFFGGPNRPGQVLMVLNGDATLYRATPPSDDAMWHGTGESDEELMKRYDLNAVKSFEELTEDVATLGKDEVLALPTPDSATNRFIESYLGREPNLDNDPDVDLVDAIMELRRCQDQGAITELKAATKATVKLQKTVLAACRPGVTEGQLKGELDRVLATEGWSTSFQPIISIEGEILHNPHYRNSLNDGDLLLVDCGAEIESGYAGDLTRTVPVSGTYSATQKSIYDIVDQARADAIDMIAPGVHFADLHKKASLTICEGLVKLGILKGDPADLVDKGVHALFFCHGLGHLVGLDVHDMEDFGDRIGYEEGEERSQQFGLSNLRLSRELETGMVVTIEPGYYNVPAILNGEIGRQFDEFLDRNVLEQYKDVRGIRIEDVVLVTEDGFENLSADLPTSSDQIVGLLGKVTANAS